MNYRETDDECPSCGASARDRKSNKPSEPQGLETCQFCRTEAREPVQDDPPAPAPLTRSQRLRDAGFMPRPRVLGAGGLLRGPSDDDPPEPEA